MNDNVIVNTVFRVARLAPPKTIKLSVPDADHVGAMLRITYDGMTQTQDGNMTVYSRPADTYHYLAEYHTPQEWEGIMSNAGWRLGAGYMYRWHYAPGRTHDHLWGLLRYDLGGEDSATGDSDDVLAEVCRQCGAWSWEINSGWQFPGPLIKWREEDPRRNEHGLRDEPFPGWTNTHPYLRATAPNTMYESHYYYVRPARYNRKTDALAKTALESTTLSIEEAFALARSIRGGNLTARGLRKACASGYIAGARKIGRDWVIPLEGLNHYLDNRPRRGRKPTTLHIDTNVTI